MTTEETAKRLIELINAGQNVQAEEELYDDNVVSIEQDGTTAKGKEAVIAKTKAAMANIAEFHGGGVTKSFVGSDTILLELSMDMTPKGGTRMQMSEYGFYWLKDGKVASEHFYMQPLV